nr:Ig-like domain-containing protein [Escherichia coli]
MSLNALSVTLADNVQLTITDAAGNSDDASRTVTVNLTAPTIGINTIATDDVINATEKGADLQITGTSNQPAGTTITVTLNGQNYTATTDSNGNWSATVPASAVSALGEANYTVSQTGDGEYRREQKAGPRKTSKPRLPKLNR